MSIRTNYCGEVTAEHVGQTVTVAGWVDTRRVHSEHLAFVDVRDHTGVVQVLQQFPHLNGILFSS